MYTSLQLGVIGADCVLGNGYTSFGIMLFRITLKTADLKRKKQSFCYATKWI